MINKIENALDSREVAEMMGIEHWKLLRKLLGRTVKGEHIKGYLEILTDNQMVVSDFFIQSTYKDVSGKENICFTITRKGCEFLANKFTGEKGVIFTARYINRFHEMEEQLRRNRKSDKPWYIREFRGKNIILYRDFEELTGINPKIYGYYSRPKCRRIIGGIDYNGWGWKCDREDFYNEYGFDYGEDNCMMYLTLTGLQKVIKFMYEECDRDEYRLAQNIADELRLISSKKKEPQKAESQPVQISITINGGSISDVNTLTTALANIR